MAIPQASLTVFFEAPFWVGLYERREAGHYRVCRIVFGPEPKDYEVLDYLLQNFHQLSFSPALPGGAGPAQAGNPKGRQRRRRPSGSLPSASRSGGQSIGDTEHRSLALRQYEKAGEKSQQGFSPAFYTERHCDGGPRPTAAARRGGGPLR